MGILHPALGEGTQLRMMKVILIACLATVAFADAKADADPYLLYGGLGYGGYYGGYYGGLGYGYGHGLIYGKRSADAEPKADADPYLLYGGYGGYGLGYGYGLGLGYRGYYWG